MPGRKVLAKDELAIMEELHVDEWISKFEYRPNYNISPSRYSPVLVKANDKRLVRYMKWGFKPAWSSRGRTVRPLINARSESILEKTTFKGLVPKNRCVILTSGYYEWVPKGERKIPHYIRPVDERLMLMAGLWKVEKNDDGKEYETYTMITANSNAQILPVHERMPAILKEDEAEIWLDCEKYSAEEAAATLKPFEGKLQYYPVSTLVNSVSNKSPDCIKRLD